MTFQSNLLDMIPFDIGYLILGIAGIEVLIFILLLVSLSSTSKMKKKYNAFMEGSDAESLEELVRLEVETINALKNNEEQLNRKIEHLYKVMNTCFQKSAVVKYDALHMGGQVSFAYCLLTKDNDGVIINSIHTREGSYLYMKEINNGSCDVILGKEEQQALLNAMANKK